MSRTPPIDTPRAAGPYALSLLDGLGLARGRQAVPLVPSAQRLVAFLAVQGRPCQRDRLAASLFVDSEPARAAGALRSTVHRVRKQAPGLLDLLDRRVGLNETTTVDLHVVERHVDEVLYAAPDAEVEPPDLDALQLELLPGWSDDWVLVERERLRQRHLHAVDRVGRRHLELGRIAEAIETGLVAAAMEPLRESSRRLLIEAHLREGNTSEAVRELARFRRLIADELGLHPTDALTALVAEHVRPIDTDGDNDVTAA